MRVLSLGAGVQSSTIALMIELGEIEPVDFAVFADTQQEPAPVYRWLDWLESEVSYPIIRATHGDLMADSLKLVYRRARGITTLRNQMPVFILGPDGVGMMPRYCSSDYKASVVRREISRALPRVDKLAMSRGEAPPVVQLIGFSVDEIVRAGKPQRVKYIRNSYPLIERGISRQECLTWMSSHGYPPPPRSACVMCPYRSDREWIWLQENDSAGFARAVQFERDLQAQAPKDEGLTGVPFLHRSCKPLDQVTFDRTYQQTLWDFAGECEGMCGL